MKKIIFTFIAGIVFIGCATIVRGGKEKIHVSSEPAGAEIIIKDKYNNQIMSGETPMTLDLDKGHGYFDGAEYLIEIQKPGFKTHSFSITSSVSGWYMAGNILIGGLIGWLIVDPTSGAMWTLDANTSANVMIDQRKVAGVEKALKILLLEEAPEHVKKKMIPVKTSK